MFSFYFSVNNCYASYLFVPDSHTGRRDASSLMSGQLHVSAVLFLGNRACSIHWKGSLTAIVAVALKRKIPAGNSIPVIQSIDSCLTADLFECARRNINI
jgi:hypothetical protein